jgi:hypothetical protein
MKKYDKVMIMNVALLLADVRSACILGDESFTELVVKSFSELDSMKRSSNVSMLYRRGSMTKKDLKIIATTSSFVPENIVAMKKALNYTGTAFPCNKFKNTILISWHLVDTEDHHIKLAFHCAKNSELSACFKDFKKMHDKAKDVNGTQIGSIQVANLVMVATPLS